MKATVAWNVRKLRVRYGLSQEALAVDAGVTDPMSGDRAGIENRPPRPRKIGGGLGRTRRRAFGRPQQTKSRQLRFEKGEKAGLAFASKSRAGLGRFAGR